MTKSLVLSSYRQRHRGRSSCHSVRARAAAERLQIKDNLTLAATTAKNLSVLKWWYPQGEGKLLVNVNLVIGKPALRRFIRAGHEFQTTITWDTKKCESQLKPQPWEWHGNDVATGTNQEHSIKSVDRVHHIPTL